MAEENGAQKEGNVLAGFVLYKNADIDLSRFTGLMKSEWDIDCGEEVKDNALVARIDDMVVACTLMGSPVPDNEAENAASYNILWNDGAKAVAEHKAHVMLAVMNKYDPLEQALLFAKAAYCLLLLDGAIGVYKDPTVYEKDFYINFAKTIKEGELPMPVMIYTGMYKSENGLRAFTSGMRFFGYNELEIIDTDKAPEDVFGFVLSIAEYIISEEVELQDGETIGFSDEQRLAITVSEGISVAGDTIKIKY